MLRCEYCSHECTVVDFVTLRNVCEHFYLDSLAKKHNPYGSDNHRSIAKGSATLDDCGELLHH